MTPAGSSPASFTFYPGESFNGAVARWAADAWIERMLDVTQYAGVRFGNRQLAAAAEDSQIRDLAKEMGVDEAELLHRALPIEGDRLGPNGITRFRGIPLPSLLVEKRIRRFAPKALSNAAYHRSLWDIRLFPACLETGQILVDRCGNPHCEAASLGWRKTMGIDRCEHCMTDLTETQSNYIQQDTLQTLRTVAQLFDPCQQSNIMAMLPREVSSGGVAVVIEFLLHLLIVVDPTIKPLKRSLLQHGLHRADPIKLAEAVASAWKIIINWPDAFEGFIADTINVRSNSHTDGNQGQTTRFLKVPSIQACSKDLADIVNRYRTSIDVNGIKANEISCRTCPIKEASKMLGLKTSEIARLRRKGVLKTEVVMEKSAKLQPLLNRPEIQMIAHGVSARNSLESVAWRLGISAYGAEQLQELGHLQLLEHPFFAARYDSVQVTRTSGDELLRQLENVALPNLRSDTMPLPIAMKVIGGRMKPWGPLVELILSGALPVFIEQGNLPVIRRISIRTECVHELGKLKYSSLKPANLLHIRSMSKKDACEILNLTPKRQTELFEPNSNPAIGNGSQINLDFVLDLAKRHITTVELGLRRGVSHRQARLDAVEMSVPLLGPAGFCRKAAEEAFQL